MISKRSQHSPLNSPSQHFMGACILRMQQSFFLRRSKSQARLFWAHLNEHFQHPNQLLSVANTIRYTPYLFHYHTLLQKFLVFKYLNGNFSHQLTARYYPLRLVLNCLFGKSIAVKKLDDLCRKLGRTFSSSLGDEKGPTADSRQCIASHCIIVLIGRYRVWPDARQAILDTLLFYLSSHLYLVHYHGLTCTWLCSTADSTTRDVSMCNANAYKYTP